MLCRKNHELKGHIGFLYFRWCLNYLYHHFIVHCNSHNMIFNYKLYIKDLILHVLTGDYCYYMYTWSSLNLSKYSQNQYILSNYTSHGTKEQEFCYVSNETIKQPYPIIHHSLISSINHISDQLWEPISSYSL